MEEVEWRLRASLKPAWLSWNPNTTTCSPVVKPAYLKLISQFLKQEKELPDTEVAGIWIHTIKGLV